MTCAATPILLSDIALDVPVVDGIRRLNPPTGERETRRQAPLRPILPRLKASSALRNTRQAFQIVRERLLLEEFVHTASGRTIKYQFTAAEEKNAPLLVIFHGHMLNPRPSKFRHPGWNVLCPVDSFGVNGAGSWFLGENGDFFWLDVIPELISQVYDGEEIYFCGSSMGGYAAILHGSRMQGVAVYANIAQTWLLGSTYSERGMKKFFSPIFGDNEPGSFNDLANVLERDGKTSYIISGLRWDKPKYLEEQTFRFINHLLENKLNFSVDLRFGEGHDLTHTMPEIADLFIKNRRALRLPVAPNDQDVPKRDQA